VFHGKVNKVICFCWGYSFWFLLIFWVLCFHEKGTFMLNSSVFIFLMLRALYRMLCKNAKSFLGKNSLNVSNVKLFSKLFFQRFLLFYAFLVRMTACTLHIKWFPWHEEPKWPQWPQQPHQPQWPQWPLQPHFIKKPLI
jgi:hypothetical protein